MRQLLILAFMLAVTASVQSVYTKYGRGCEDIGCSSNEECVIEEDVCTIQSKGHCGKYPTCKRVKQKANSCENYVCPSTQVCQVKNKEPRCVDSVPGRHRRQSYNPNSPTGEQSTSNTEPKYPQLDDIIPNAPKQSKMTTERSNVYKIGYSQSQGAYPSLTGDPTQKPRNKGYPTQGYPNQGYPSQGYPNQGYPNQGYPSQGYSNQGYPSQGYPNQGYPNQGYPSQGYPNQGYPNQGFPNQGYPQQGYPNQGYPQQGYPNQGYPNQGNPNQGYPNQVYPNQGNPNQGYPNQGYQNNGYPNQGYPGYQNPGYQPGYQNQGYPGQQGHNQKPGFFDPILNTLSRTVTQIGANYIRDKLFNNNSNRQKQIPTQ